MLTIDAPELMQLVPLLSGVLHGDSLVFSGVEIDSRRIALGNLFVALRGPNFDGHDFLQVAKDAGAVAAIVERVDETVALPQLKVNDTLVALTTLAGIWRAQVSIPVLGITGSNGKTTVKEMLAAILSKRAVGLKTEGNFNNEIGVPLTLLKLTSSHHWAVIEMGASHSGEIDRLARLAKPTVALVNNISSAHSEGFGTLEDTARAKGKIFSHLQSGTAVMPEGSVYQPIWEAQSSANETLTFGDNSAASVWFEADDQGLQLHTPQGDIAVQLSLCGIHNYYNAAAATTMALACNASLSEIKQGLEAMPAVQGRLELKGDVNGLRVIDDTYNANPSSAKVALDYLTGHYEHTIFILGDMGELGEAAADAHEAVGHYANGLGLSALYTVGEVSRHASDVFQGLSNHYENKAALMEAIKKRLTKQSVVLVKGSRFMRMETVVDALLNDVRQEENI